MRKRNIPIESIPKSLWDGTIYLPKVFVPIHTALLDFYNLREYAKTYVRKIVGGKSEQEALNHYGQRFILSSSKIEYALIAPTPDFDQIHNTLQEILSEGEVAVLDIACGSGAATIGLLSTLIHLRESGPLSTQPLNLSIYAGDFSDKALEIFQKQLVSLSEAAAAVGIKINHRLVHWDISDGDDNSNNIEEFFNSTQHITEYLVLISAVSSALGKDPLRDSFWKMFNYLLMRFGKKQVSLLWIEPTSDDARGFFRKLDPVFNFFKTMWGKKTDILSAEYEYFHFIQDRKQTGRLIVREFRNE